MIPTLTDFVTQIEAVSGATAVDADIPLMQISDIDSMDMMEWLYTFQSKHPGAGVDPSIFDNDDGTTTLRIVHERLNQVAAAV